MTTRRNVMKLLKKIILGLTLASVLLSFQLQADAASNYTVKKGDTLWNISKKNGVSVSLLKKVNHKATDYLYIGERIQIPTSVSAYEKDLLARLVYAEAKGEPYAGKVAVATVVLNRVDSSVFPNTIREVITQKEAGHYAFTPVQNGEIKKAADQASMKAVNEALAFRGMGKGSLYFYNPVTAKSKWILSRETTVTIGHHRFAK